MEPKALDNLASIRTDVVGSLLRPNHLKQAYAEREQKKINDDDLRIESQAGEVYVLALAHEAFGVPDDHTVCCLIALGHAAAAKPFSGRFGLDVVCYEEHFGQPWTLGDGNAEG